MQKGDSVWALNAIVKGDRIMLRKLLLPMLATAALAGCATGYQYRGGQGDYYYGQPQVEYRQSGPSGFYGDVGLGYGSGFGFGGFGYGFGASYFYDRYGRLVYGYPSQYFGSPYYGRGGGYHPRYPRHPGGHGDAGDDHHDNDDNHNDDHHQDGPPPWRDLGRLQPRNPGQDGHDGREDRQRPMRRLQPESSSNSPMRVQRSNAVAPAIRERREPSSRPAGSNDGAARARATGHSERRIED